MKKVGLHRIAAAAVIGLSISAFVVAPAKAAESQ
jgi:hypothetical protein